MNKEFNKGLFLAGFGSFWWGFFGVLYFKYITYIGHIELVVHRCLWTTFTLILISFLQIILAAQLRCEKIFMRKTQINFKLCIYY